jgi:hypothetical protein
LDFAGEKKMKTIRNLIFSSVVLLLLAPMLRAQDLSKYRQFTFGMSLTAVLKHTDQRLADVKAVHSRPALIQELEWWPPNLPGSSFQSDTVKQIFLSFYNGELYKISVSYDQSSTEGLTTDDMVKSISQKYGPPTSVAVATDAAKNDHYDLKPTVVASWEDAQYSFNLVRSSYADRLGLVIYSKRVNEQADLAIAEAVKLDQQEGPQREAALQKKQIDDLAAARQKNQRIFRP